MMVRYPVILALVVAIAGSTAAQAQTRRASMLPAETPPADFEPGQYVDSRGCVFVRAGSNGLVTWLPLLGTDRQPQCGFRPSLGGVPFQPGPPGLATAGEADRPATDPQTGTDEPDTADAAPDDPRPEAEPVVIAAPEAPGPAAEPPAAPPADLRVVLRVIERRGQIIEVAPDPNARSVLRVIEQRGLLFYPDA